MSFRLFLYYCAVIGGCAAFGGWALGREAAAADVVRLAGIKGMYLGALLAAGLSVLDVRGRSAGRLLRAVVVAAIGGVGGMAGGLVGQALYSWQSLSGFLVFGWTLTGLLIGASLGIPDLLVLGLRGRELGGVRRRVLNGLIGGGVGGLLGGVVFLQVKRLWAGEFADKAVDLLWSPSAIGFVALGSCISLAIGLAQVILKEAWVRVEKGFRAGREMLLVLPDSTIGRAEFCTIGLFGDAAVERLHAHIVRKGDRHYLTDAGTPGGTYRNGMRVSRAVLLHSGDCIQVGQCVLRFGERKCQDGQ